MKLKVIITGASGRIASHLANELTTDMDVVRVSRVASKDAISYDELFESSHLQSADGIFHGAWSTVPQRAECYPPSVWTDDLPLLAQLLEAIRQLPDSQRPFCIYPSSGGSIYGNAPGRANTEKDELAPIGWYGIGKQAAETLIEKYTQIFGLNICVLRLANPYGLPHHKQTPQGLVGAALEAAQSGAPVNIWGDGSARKDYIHIEDTIAAIREVLRLKLCGTYNLSTGTSTSISTLLNKLENLCRNPISRIYHPAPKWDVSNSWLSPQKLIDSSGWRPSISLDEGLLRITSHYSQKNSNLPT